MSYAVLAGPIEIFKKWLNHTETLPTKEEQDTKTEEKA